MRRGEAGWRRIEGSLPEHSVRFVDIGVELSVHGVEGEFVRWSVCRCIRRSVLLGTGRKMHS